MNAPVREFKSPGESKAEGQTEDFAAVLESSTAAEKAEPEAKADAEGKDEQRPGDKKSEKSEDSKAEKDISIPLLPTQVILQKSQESITAAASLTAAAPAEKKPEGANAAAAAEPGTKVAADETKETPGLEFKIPAQTPEIKSPEAQAAEQAMPKDESAKPESMKPEAARAKPAEPQIAAAAADPARDANSVEPRNADNIPAAERPAADRNIQTASREIMHRAETLKEGESTTIKVKLHPEGLGEMEITVSMEKGKLSGSILVENKEARQIFSERIHELHQTLKDSSISVAKFDVGIGAGQDQNQGRQQGQRHVFYQNRTMRYMDEISQFDEGQASGRLAVKGIDVLA